MKVNFYESVDEDIVTTAKRELYEEPIDTAVLNGGVFEEDSTRMKIITICGSYRFREEMLEIAEKLTLAGNCVLTPIELSKYDKEAYTEEEVLMIDKMHKEKIGLSDVIYVVNVGGYIGKSTKSEIEYAKSLNKEILYYAGENI